MVESGKTGARLKQRLGRPVLLASAVLAGLLWAAPAGWSQSCAMCYASAAGAGPAAAGALRLGILVLLIPTVVLLLGVVVLIVRRARAASTSA